MRVREKAHPWFDCVWNVRHIRNGHVIGSESGRNDLLDEGERAILLAYFRGEEQPTQFYIRLCNDTLIETDTLADVQNEPTGNGYSAQKVERSDVGFPTMDMDAGDYRILSKTVTFTANGGTIGPVTSAFLATTADNTGKLIATRALSITRTVLNGDSLKIDIRIKLI